MELSGKIIAILPQRSGTSKTGNPWESQDFVIETSGEYPKKMCFNVWGAEKLNQFNIQQGEELTVSFDIDCREWNGKWFNTIRAWKVERGQQPIKSADDMYQNTAPEHNYYPNPKPSDFINEGQKDDLPF